METIYDFSAQTLQGKNITLSDYRGNYVLIVNTASQCWLTPQFEWLEKLYHDYKDKGLVILWFPSNQFAQELWSNDEIEQVCRLNYGVTFPMFETIIINGKDTHPLYVYLKKALPGLLTNAIKRNFTKFLIWPDGSPLHRFSPIDEPKKIEQYLQKVMN